MRNRDYEKQQRIKAAMVKLMLREGINGTSVAKIAHEAGVSPATIYIYYSSKEEMMAEVFAECSHQSYRHLMRRIHPEMNGAELIATIVREYYAYAVEHEEIFSFVEQCSRCPKLSESVSEEECSCDLLDLLHKYQERGIVKKYSDMNLGAVLFSPVRFIAMHSKSPEINLQAQPDELILMLQELLLI